MIESVPKNHYVYWVTYQFQTPHSNSGVAGARIFSTAKASSLLWIEATQEWVTQQQSFSKVLIVNWKRLKEDESWDDEANNGKDECIAINRRLINDRDQLIIDRDHWRAAYNEEMKRTEALQKLLSLRE